MTPASANTGIRRFYRELVRRRVIRVAAVYVVVAWAMIEVGSVVFPELMLPDWSVRLLIMLAALGFPLVLVLAWIFDLTPEGVQRTPASGETGAGTVAPPPGRSLAVLPFRNIGGDRENEYFGDGLAEDLLIVLSRVRGLRVAARSSSFAFRDHQTDVREIGERLKVANVLEGSVRRSGSQLRVTVRLVDTADGYQRWTRAFDREEGDIFEIQDEISRAVSDALDIEVYGADGPRVTPGTRDVEAYNLYLMGRHQFHKRTEDALGSAVRFFEQAIERDPRFALPYSGLADAYCLLSNSGEGYGRMPTREAIARATPMVERALELDPRLAEAHASKGFLLRLSGEFEAAEAALRGALELDPGYPMAHVWLGLTLSDLGRLQESLREFNEAYDRDPLSPIVGTNLGFAHLKLGHFDTARDYHRRVIEIAPEFPVAYSGMAYLERRLGHLDEARDWWEKAARIATGRAFYPTALALLHLERGDTGAAEAALARAESLSANDPFVVRGRVAVLAATDRTDELVCFTEDRLEGGRREDLANAGLAHLLAGHPRRALDLYERAGVGLQRWIADALVWSWRFPHSLYYAAALLEHGERRRGLEILDQAERLFDRLEGEGLVNPDLYYHRAVVLALRGDTSGARRMLERAEAGGWTARWWSSRDPVLSDLSTATPPPAD